MHSKACLQQMLNLIPIMPFCREVVERRTYTVTGQKASPEEIDRLIETGESEQIFQKAILEQGRGHVCLTSPASESLHDAASQRRFRQPGSGPCQESLRCQ